MAGGCDLSLSRSLTDVGRVNYANSYVLPPPQLRPPIQNPNGSSLVGKEAAVKATIHSIPPHSVQQSFFYRTSSSNHLPQIPPNPTMEWTEILGDRYRRISPRQPVVPKTGRSVTSSSSPDAFTNQTRQRPWVRAIAQISAVGASSLVGARCDEVR